MSQPTMELSLTCKKHAKKLNLYLMFYINILLTFACRHQGNQKIHISRKLALEIALQIPPPKIKRSSEKYRGNAPHNLVVYIQSHQPKEHSAFLVLSPEASNLLC